MLIHNYRTDNLHPIDFYLNIPENWDIRSEPTLLEFTNKNTGDGGPVIPICHGIMFYSEGNEYNGHTENKNYYLQIGGIAFSIGNKMNSIKVITGDVIQTIYSIELFREIVGGSDFKFFMPFLDKMESFIKEFEDHYSVYAYEESFPDCFHLNVRVSDEITIT